jgi:hypothetical protein
MMGAKSLCNMNVDELDIGFVAFLWLWLSSMHILNFFAVSIGNTSASCRCEPSKTHGSSSLCN